jgi:thiamine-monophosphate kinase
MLVAMASELDLIERIRRRAAKLPRDERIRLGIGDDCAVLAPQPGEEVVVTTDFSLEGRHFDRELHTARSAGHRTLARGLSDLAAMGAVPMAVFLSLAVPLADAQKPRWLNTFLDGLLELATAFDVSLAGGDTGQSPEGTGMLADIVATGTLPAGTALRRDGAKPGDALYVTGALGGAAQELACLQSTPTPWNERFHGTLRWRDIDPARNEYPQLFPAPRIAQGIALRERKLATACMDLSDGLSTDLAHLCRASNVCAEVDLSALPVARRLRSADEVFLSRCVLHGGEDYELLFTASDATKVPKKLLGVPVTRIGRLLRPAAKRPLVTLLGTNGYRDALVPGGWEHLR